MPVALSQSVEAEILEAQIKAILEETGFGEGEPDADIVSDIENFQPSSELRAEIPDLWESCRQHPLLTLKEEKALFQELEEKPDDPSIIEKIVVSNLRLVVYWANKVRNKYPMGRSLQSHDLCQEGVCGLMTAIRKFEYRRGYKFVTYAYKWVRQSVIRAIRSSSLIHISEDAYNLMGRYFKAREELVQKLGREPSLEEMARVMEISVEKMREIQRVILLRNPISLDKPPQGDDGRPLPLLLKTPDSDSMEGLEREVLRMALREAVLLLKSRKQREALFLRFGLGDGRFQTLEEVGGAVGTTREGARLREENGLKSLREILELPANQGLKEALREFL